MTPVDAHTPDVAALQAELTELRLQCIAADGQAGEAHSARIAAEAERDRLRARVEAEEAFHRARHADFILAKGRDPAKYHSSHLTIAVAIRAALTPNTGTAS
jgi:hypothetical protein